MTQLQQYERRQDGDPVIAIQLIGGEDGMGLDGGGIAYRKWGGDQWASQGDWIVKNGSEIYTVEAESFAGTYTQVGHGHYRKIARIWAERATGTGMLSTKEGMSEYAAGDWLAYNEPDRGDGYVIKPADFERLYRAVGGDQ